MWEEETLPKKSKVAAYALGVITTVVIGLPIYVGGYLVLLTDWLPISIGISGWWWAFFWGWGGAVVAVTACGIVMTPFVLLFYLIGVFRKSASQ